MFLKHHIIPVALLDFIQRGGIYHMIREGCATRSVAVEFKCIAGRLCNVGCELWQVVIGSVAVAQKQGAFVQLSK